MKTILTIAVMLFLVLSVKAQEPVQFVFTHDIDVVWETGKPVMEVRVYGVKRYSTRDSVCPALQSGLYIDAKKTRLTLEDSEGRRCEIVTIEQLPVDRDTTKPLAKVRITFMDEDEGSPRLPMTGRISLRMHESPLNCTKVERIVHMLQWNVDSSTSGPVDDFRDNYLSIAVEK